MNHTHLLFTYKSTFASLHDLSQGWKSVPLETRLTHLLFRYNPDGKPRVLGWQASNTVIYGHLHSYCQKMPYPLFFTCSTIFLAFSIYGQSFCHPCICPFLLKRLPKTQKLLLLCCPNTATIPNPGVSKVISKATSALCWDTPCWATLCLDAGGKSLPTDFKVSVAPHYLTNSLRQISLLSLDFSTSFHLGFLSQEQTIKTKATSSCVPDLPKKTSCGMETGQMS